MLYAKCIMLEVADLVSADMQIIFTSLFHCVKLLTVCRGETSQIYYDIC